MSLRGDQEYLERFMNWLEKQKGLVVLYPANETLSDLITEFTVEVE